MEAAIFFLLFLCTKTEAFVNLAEEQQFVSHLVDQSTRSTVHSEMRNNTVYFYLDLYQILSINEKEGVVNLKLWVFLSYYLPHLQWNASDYGGISAVSLPENTLWVPDIVFFDATEVVDEVYTQQTIYNFGLVIAKSSTVNMKLTCDVKVRYFPFDTQVRQF